MVAVGLVPGAAQAKVRARIGDKEVRFGNGLVERTWSVAPFRTTSLTDLRTGRRWSRDRRDFALVVGKAEIGSRAFHVEDAQVAPLPGGGKRLTLTLGGVPGLQVTRTVDLRPDVAGMRTQTTVTSAVPAALSSVILEEAAVGAATPTIHAFRAGADWREPGWPGPGLHVGTPHPGTWRDTHTAARGATLRGPAQWLTAQRDSGSLVLVDETTDFPSTFAAYDGKVASVRQDYGRDVILLGPFEEQAHAENPADTPARQRVLHPGVPLALDPVWIGVGDHAGDAELQWARELHARAPWRRDVVFNSDRIDDGGGAKDSMTIGRVREIAPIARALGVETFVLDDGWQAISGDWCPESPQCPDQTGDVTRFPDSSFSAVRQAIGDMRLGLWMSPLHFHPASKTFATHPDWACQPVSTALLAYNKADDSGSNEAGIVEWGAKALPHIEASIRRAITQYGATYFKFDFIAWLDCAGQNDMYEFRDGFVQMIDRLRAAHPDVVFSIDETNDYRLFPFNSTTRGPTWFQNGNPDVRRLLHNLWDLSPYVPASALGQAVATNSDDPVDTRMAAALLSHVTFFSDIRKLDAATIAASRRWIDFYKAHRDAFTAGVVYPLLADPLRGGWTALQSWDGDHGALLAFRQDSATDTRHITPRNLPHGTYELTSAPDGASLGTADLADGIDITLPRRGARVILFDRTR
jgi:hypothetical protein